MKLHFLGTGAADWDIVNKDNDEFIIPSLYYKYRKESALIQ